MKHVKIEIIAKGEILVNRPEKFLINFSTMYDDIERYFGRPHGETITMLSYPDKKIEHKSIVFTNPVIVFSYSNDILYMMDIHKETPLIYNNINLSKASVNETIEELSNLGIEHIYFDDITLIFPKINLFIGIVDTKLENIGIYKDNCFEDMKKDEIKYKLRNSKREDGVLTYYFDYK